MLKEKLQFDKIVIQRLRADVFTENNIQADVLRLDKLHDVVSGNKWFKLKYWLEDFKTGSLSELATFGGAYSNHIVAVAFAAMQLNIPCTGIIRGEKPSLLSHTLQQAEIYGMILQFVSRNEYQDKEKIKQTIPDAYWIEEGGYGKQGAKGASEILDYVPNLAHYTHILCAVGTGTMLAGLCKAALPHQQVIGISVMKNNLSIHEQVKQLSACNNFTIFHDYHFGGYAKHPPALLAFMRDVWKNDELPTDIVYTSKALYALQKLVEHNHISQGSKVLMMHSGGLQGNLSLPAGSLPFL